MNVQSKIIWLNTSSLPLIFSHIKVTEKGLYNKFLVVDFSCTFTFCNDVVLCKYKQVALTQPRHTALNLINFEDTELFIKCGIFFKLRKKIQ